MVDQLNIAQTGVACLMNRRSGGRKERHQARLLEHDRRVMVLEDIAQCSPEAFVQRYADRYPVLVACGGDGTAAALATAMHQQQVSAALAVIPTGTGNDLARALNWRAQLGPLDTLEAIDDGSIRPLNRWILQGPSLNVSWFNYCSFGSDARIAKRFDRLRSMHDWLFRGVLMNKLIYVGLGLTEPAQSLPVHIAGARVPTWCGSLVFTNIASYAGGGCLGPAINHSDGICEAYPLPPGLMLGVATHGPRQACGMPGRSAWTIQIDRPTMAQTDGEARLLQAGVYTLSCAGSVAAVHYAKA